MTFFLGFFPNQKSNYKIRKVVREMGKVFDDFSIPVRWVKPESYHISLYYLGESMNFLKLFFLKRRLKGIKFTPFTVTLRTVKLGISKQYKELVYLDLKEGGEKLRDLLLSVRGMVKEEDINKFVPHLTIGRISKDLSNEEYKNVVRDICNMSEKLNIEDISFEVNELYLVKSIDGSYTVLMRFNDSFSTRS